MNLQQEINFLNNEISELNKEMLQIKNTIRDVEDEKEVLFSQLMKPLIGKAFKQGTVYYLISDIPRPEGMTNKINWYQIPCISFNSTGLDSFELSSDTLFSRACEYDDPIKYFKQMPIFEEITLEEFKSTYLELFNKELNKIKEGVSWNG